MRHDQVTEVLDVSPESLGNIMRRSLGSRSDLETAATGPTIGPGINGLIASVGVQSRSEKVDELLPAKFLEVMAARVWGDE